MRIFYPYNEILPKKKAHDVYLFNECASLANAGADVTLLCGRQSWNDVALAAHYQTSVHSRFCIRRLPIIRKNNFLNLSWNLPFFFFCQKEIEHLHPDFVFLSVLKQAAFHLSRKIKGVKYVYEVHQLQWYPTDTGSLNKVESERNILEKADLITVTTLALHDILRKPPYCLTNPIEVLPLAVKTSPIPAVTEQTPFTIAYVGQLYEGQGIPFLLEALTIASNIHLKIIGGTRSEIEQLQTLVKENKLDARVQFLGFHPPSNLPSLLQNVHAFVAPFEPIGRMPFVAHTKLFEYAEWGRPVIAPDLPITREHFAENQGIQFFKPGDVHSLADALKTCSVPSRYPALLQKIQNCSGYFSWEKRSTRYFKLLEKILG